MNNLAQSPPIIQLISGPMDGTAFEVPVDFPDNVDLVQIPYTFNGTEWNALYELRQCRTKADYIKGTNLPTS